MSTQGRKRPRANSRSKDCKRLRLKVIGRGRQKAAGQEEAAAGVGRSKDRQLRVHLTQPGIGGLVSVEYIPRQKICLTRLHAWFTMWYSRSDADVSPTARQPHG